jgi:hypothetical protein
MSENTEAKGKTKTNKKILSPTSQPSQGTRALDMRGYFFPNTYVAESIVMHSTYVQGTI